MKLVEVSVADFNGEGIALLAQGESDAALTQTWQATLPENIRTAAPLRQDEWIRSRACLQTAFAKFGVTVTTFTEVVDYRHLEGVPGFTFSLSHAKESALVWLVRERPGSKLSVGVDIERAQREISVAVQARYRHADDIERSPIELWAIKEAAFKAIPRAKENDIYLNKISISDGRFECAELGLSGSWSLIYVETFICAFAWIS